MLEISEAKNLKTLRQEINKLKRRARAWGLMALISLLFLVFSFFSMVTTKIINNSSVDKFLFAGLGVAALVAALQYLNKDTDRLKLQRAYNFKIERTAKKIRSINLKT